MLNFPIQCVKIDGYVVACNLYQTAQTSIIPKACIAV